jgi:transcription elongation factor Elf1
MPRPAKNAITGEIQESVPTVIQRPIACPSCGSDSRTQLEAYESIDAEGEYQGFKFTRVVKARTTCKNCGNRYRVKTYSNSSASELKGTL